MGYALTVALVGIGALILGAVLGRYYVPDLKGLRRAVDQGKVYARALTFVLTGERGRATGELAKVVEGDVHDIEPYFAIGCLFRERGEHERAVRVHQSVILRHDSDAETRQRARYELGLDFLAAGFRRHAAQAFREVLERDGRHLGALRSLWRLYEESGQFGEALEAYRRLCRVDGSTGDRTLEAHLLAEQAASDARAGELDSARRKIREAEGLDPTNPHVLAVAAQLERARGAVTEAAALWIRALRAAPNLAPWIYPLLEEALFEAGRMDDLGELLDELLDEHGTIPLRLCRARLTAKRNPQEATEDLKEILAEAPALLAAREELGRLLLHYGTTEAIRVEYEALLDSLKRLGRGYRCSECGDAAADLFWRCLGCGAWGTVRLVWGRRAGEGGATGASDGGGGASSQVPPRVALEAPAPASRGTGSGALEAPRQAVRGSGRGALEAPRQAVGSAGRGALEAPARALRGTVSTPDEEAPDEEAPDEETPDEEAPDEEAPDEALHAPAAEEPGKGARSVPPAADRTLSAQALDDALAVVARPDGPDADSPATGAPATGAPSGSGSSRGSGPTAAPRRPDRPKK